MFQYLNLACFIQRARQFPLVHSSQYNNVDHGLHHDVPDYYELPFRSLKAVTMTCSCTSDLIIKHFIVKVAML